MCFVTFEHSWNTTGTSVNNLINSKFKTEKRHVAQNAIILFWKAFLTITMQYLKVASSGLLILKVFFNNNNELEH